MDMIVRQYNRARKRLLLFDYDGTLRDFELKPELATPTTELREILTNLAADKKNTVTVISGRSHEVLDSWLGGLPLHFIAEHGMAYCSPGGSWEFAAPAPINWQVPVGKLMEEATSAVPGSLVETKTNSLVWHYRSAEVSPQTALAALLDAMVPLVEEHRLRLFHSDKSMAVDVQPAGTDKGSSTRHWFNLNDYDFILAAGDDVTDEDLFGALPARAFTIKVGEGETVAAYHQPTVADMLKLLSTLAAASQ